jgi:hypothetical protein
VQLGVGVHASTVRFSEGVYDNCCLQTVNCRLPTLVYGTVDQPRPLMKSC